MWEKILPDLLAIAVLGAALILGIVDGMHDLAANIAIGLIGYIGGKATTGKKEGDKNGKSVP